MPSPRVNPVWAELIQLVPVITLASSFLIAGEVDLARAGPLFLLASVLAVPISAGVLSRGHVLNPILVGAGWWLALGALAFGLPVPALAGGLAETRGAGLFTCALAVGAIATVSSPVGYVGARHPDPSWVRRASVVLLALTALAVAWSFVFRADLRLGGGLPFIVLNVARRLMVAQGSRSSAS